jgi:hypothetical protein
MARALLLVAVLACAGCPDDDSGNGTDYVAFDDLEAAYKDALCTHLAACGEFADHATCMQAELSLTNPLPIPRDTLLAMARGHMIYDGANVYACFTALAERSCDRTSESARMVPPACGELFRGLLTAGQQCYVDEECVSRTCTDASLGTCSPGVCVGSDPPVAIRAAIGEACETSSACVDGAYCDVSSGLCAALLPIGSACTLDGECAYGLGCPGPIGSRTCDALPTVGQPCTADGLCRDEGVYCDGSTNLCTSVGLPGAACPSGIECSPYYACVAAACAQGPGLGDMCSSAAPCFDAGTYCDFAAGLCVMQGPDGGTCNSDAECASDFCDLSTSPGTCASPMTCRA